MRISTAYFNIKKRYGNSHKNKIIIIIISLGLGIIEK